MARNGAKAAVVSGLIALVVAALFLSGPPNVFPIDDAYIHFAYAENLVSGRGLIFHDPGETGLGTTSALWVAWLALGQRLGLSTQIAARGLGVLGLALAAALTALVVEPRAERWQAQWVPWAAGGLVALCGPMIWFALSGMETTLFTAIGLAAILLYRAQRWAWLGIACGLLCLTRPEGVGLPLAVGLVEAARNRRPHRGLLAAIGLAGLIALPWFAYVFFRTGQLLPGSYYGKQFTQQMAIEYFVNQLSLPRVLAELRPVIFVGLSLGYWLMFYWGGAYLPGPEVGVASGAAAAPGAAWLGIAVGGLWVALVVRGLWQLWRLRDAMPEDERWGWLAFGAWLAFHNGAFALFLPAPGTASRYIAVNYVMLAVAASLGLASLCATNTKARRHEGTKELDLSVLVSGCLRVLPTLVVLIVSVFTLTFWRAVYESSVRQVAEVRIEMAERVEQRTPPDSVVAAFDIGVIGYYTDRPIADLGGLVDSELIDYAEDGNVEDFLCQEHARYIVAPESSAGSGGSYYDYLGSLGLTNDPTLRLVEMTRVAMDADDWQLGGAATGNSTAAVVMYEVVQECER